MSKLMMKLLTKRARIAVVGLGYVGTPLLISAADAGFEVIGIDEDKNRINTLKNEPSSGSLSLDTSFEGLKLCDVVCICVPTPLDKYSVPDMSHVDSAVASLLPHIHRDMLIVLESTTYPTTTADRIAPLIEGEGYKIGEDVFLATSPERIDPGSPDWNIKNTAKVVGGMTEKCTSLAWAFYDSIIDADVMKVSSPTVAEAEKLFENVYRNVNIALANELALLCDRMGISVWEVIAAAKTKPYGFSAFYPGLGVDGHCIPLDPWYLAYKARECGYHPVLIEAAGRINDDMPRYVMSRASKNLSRRGAALKDAKILMLGAAYKANVSDLRESPALKLCEMLKNEGAIVTVWEPLSDDPRFKKNVAENEIAESDLVIVGAPHECFDFEMIAMKAKAVLDTKNTFKNVKNRQNIDLL